MSGYTIRSEQWLADAFAALFDFVLALPTSGANPADAPCFTYLLTQKQRDEIDRVCVQHGWPMINCPGILIDVDSIRHPLGTRQAKDGVTDGEVKLMLTKSYSHRSLVRANRGRDQQAIILNNQQSIRVGGDAFHAMAILEIKSDGLRNYLAPVTCYHANEAKVRAIQR